MSCAGAVVPTPEVEVEEVEAVGAGVVEESWQYMPASIEGCE